MSNISNFVDIAVSAGRIAKCYFNLGAKTSATIEYKNGGSPVTSADLAADTYLKTACAKAFSGYEWLSEETEDKPTRHKASKLIIADPIDGTRAFIDGNKYWCVSLAMIENGHPVMACLYAPALDDIYVAEFGQGASLNNASISFDYNKSSKLDAFGSKEMIANLNNKLNINLVKRRNIPSLALRLAMIASGGATVALATKNSSDWDIAAADLILREAGGVLQDFKGQAPIYNKVRPVHPELFASSKSMAELIINNHPIDRSSDEGYRAVTADSEC
jgi:myo-inositol-1(or 4)-monophosphatase